MRNFQAVGDGVYKILSGSNAGKFALTLSFEYAPFKEQEFEQEALIQFSEEYGNCSLEFHKGEKMEQAETGSVELVSASEETLNTIRKNISGKRISLDNAEEVWADYGYTDDNGSWVAEDRKPLIHGTLRVVKDQ